MLYRTKIIVARNKIKGSGMGKTGHMKNEIGGASAVTIFSLTKLLDNCVLCNG